MILFQKVFGLLSKKEKNTSCLIFGLMLIGMSLEMLSIGLIIPIISLLSQQELVENNYPFLKVIIEQFGSPEYEQIIIGAMIILALVYLVKNLFLAGLVWFQNRFVFGIQANHTQRLFKLYLKQPYTFHLQHNSAQLIRNVQVEIGLFASNVIKPLLQLITEVLVFIGLCALMLSIELVGTIIIVIVMSIAAWAYQFVTKKYVTQWGIKRQYHDGKRFQHIHQGLGGVKDVILLGREQDFIEQYNKHTKVSVKIYELQNTIMQMPRLWLELLSVLALTSLVLGLLAQGKNMNQILPVLGLFAAAAFRIMPSISRMLGSLQLLRYANPVLNMLYNELKLSNSNKLVQSRCQNFVFNKSFEMKKNSYRYPGVSEDVLKNISICIKKGQTVGIVGHTGSGKSTFVDIILGLLSPQNGDILIDGKDVRKNIRSWQDKIGYVPQSIYLTDDTIKKNIAFGLPEEQIDIHTIKNALDSAQLSKFIDELDNGINTVVGERGIRLSGGQRQRIGIARALYHQPEVLVLDEATSSLDGVTENAVMEVINNLSKKITVIMVAHRLTTVRECDVIYLMENGEIVDSGQYTELINRNEKFKAMANSY